MAKQRDSKHPRTQLIHSGDDPFRWFGAAAPPIFETSTFTFPDTDAAEAAMDQPDRIYHYTRGLNPTVEVAERKIATLEGGEACRCFGSGMGAIAAAIISQLKAGDHVVAVRSIYGPTYSLLTRILSRFGVTHTFVAGTEVAEFAAAITPQTRLIYLESPSSLVLKLQDLAAVAALARHHGIVTAIDNSWATPLYQKPLALGIDLVIHTATKYLAGHSDTVAGAVVGRAEVIRRIAATEFALLGAALGPMEGWLLVRGMRTLAVRLAAHQQSARQIAAWLEQHPRVRRVHYPGLPSHPQYELAQRQMTGCSGLLSFELDSEEPAVTRRCVDSLQYYGLGVSWGGFESLVWAPIVTQAKRVPREQWAHSGVIPGLIRLSIGLEDAADLQADLEQALAGL